MDKHKILVVDDDPLVLEMARDALEEIDCEVHTHSSAMGTNSKLFSIRPKILVLDIDMPGLLKGDRICQIIKSQGFFDDLKVLLFSSIGEDKLAKLAEQHQADAYLSKTNNIRELQNKILELL